MPNPKKVLVVTTSTIEGRKVKRHLKPVTAHIVAGTNVFSDIFASFSDFFGGRSGSYQRQLTSLYDEAIHKVKLAAYEIGANCVVGLSIDMDEISGKNKSMFMLTAIGTAIILEDAVNEPPVINDSDEKFENVSYERLDVLYRKKNLLKKANDQLFNLDDDQWQFITTNQVKEIFPFLLKCYQAIASGQLLNITIKEFYDKLLTYVSAFSDEARTVMLYESIINETNERILSVLSSLINDTQLMDFNYVHQLLIHTDFQKQKIGLQIITYNKPFYNADDIKTLQGLTTVISENFKERGTKTTKKQMLSSKEKEIWVCECGKTNDIPGYTAYCDNCTKDIYGFKATDVTPVKALTNLKTKIELISELIS
jgi:uncharacterized protein YbjQ (UPF0145 family)/CDGSH-type Zn-finger protein